MNIQGALGEFFDPAEVKWKPQRVSGDRAMAIAYVDARVVMDRLDDVIGTGNWQDHYEHLEGGSVVCRLSVRVGDEWISKTDVGSPSEQPDEGDRMKSAFSDALKRAAVKFGIGRYLYSLPKQWVKYDPQKKQFAEQPKLPGWALPAKKPAPAAVPEPAPTPPAATPAPAEAEHPDAAAVRDWMDWLAMNYALSELNEYLTSDFAGLTEPAKKQVWPLIRASAKQRGFRWDDARKAFVAKEETSERR